jgi:hypothetical protein
MLMTASVNASDDGSKIDYDQGWSPYVTLRGRWFFSGDVKGDYSDFGHPENKRSSKKV